MAAAGRQGSVSHKFRRTEGGLFLTFLCAVPKHEPKEETGIVLSQSVSNVFVDFFCFSEINAPVN